MAILAQYTIRSKQSFIFRSNAMREITGGSRLIRDAWLLLFREAKNAELKTKSIHASSDSKDFDFSYDDPDDAFSNDLQMIDLFNGGGNDTVLFRDKECMILCNAAFTRAVLDECPGMIPMCAWIETGRDYKEDYQKLMSAAECEKNRMSPGLDFATAPFSMMDRKTFRPVVCRRQENDEYLELTAEAKAKREKFKATTKDSDNIWLDNIGSKLAVVHADGNNMGSKIKKLLGDSSSYRECVPKMRNFTESTARAFTGDEVDKPRGVLDAYAKEKGKEAIGRQEVNDYGIRWIICDGDDATFVCNANHALELTEKYLEEVLKQEYFDEGNIDDDSKPLKYNSCAGICLFHSHYPFSMAYTMAEEACESAKVKVHMTPSPENDKEVSLPGKKTDNGKSAENPIVEESWIDFHYIHSGLNDDLKNLRVLQGTDDRMARPWAVHCDKQDETMTTENLKWLAERLRLFHGVTRTNIKTLGAAWERNPAEGKAELRRVGYRSPGLIKELTDRFGNETTALKAVYDLSEVYDLWFAPKLESIAMLLDHLRKVDNQALEDFQKAETKEQKAFADLKAIDGWEQLLRKGE